MSCLPSSLSICPGSSGDSSPRVRLSSPAGAVVAGKVREAATGRKREFVAFTRVPYAQPPTGKWAYGPYKVSALFNTANVLFTSTGARRFRRPLALENSATTSLIQANKKCPKPVQLKE